MIQIIFGARAKDYDWDASRNLFKTYRCRDAVLLDVGCGNGIKTQYHRDLVDSVVALDVSFRQLKRAKKLGFEVVAASATSLPFQKESFDIVTSFHVVEHVNDDLAMMNEISRVLKPNGKAILVTPNRMRITSILYRFLIRSRVVYPFNPNHVHEYTLEDLHTLFANSRFCKWKIKGIGFIRLPYLAITTVPRSMERLSDQILVELTK